MPILQRSGSARSQVAGALLSDSVNEIATPHSHDASHQNIINENALLKKIIPLQDKLRELEEKNTLLTRHRNLLLKQVSSLQTERSITSGSS